MTEPTSILGLTADPLASFGEAVSEAAGIAMGYVSVCWDPKPTGVFESTRAAQAVQELTAFIVERAIEMGNHTPQQPAERDQFVSRDHAGRPWPEDRP